MSLYHNGMDVQRNWCPQYRRWFNDPIPTRSIARCYRTGITVGAPFVATPGTIKEEVVNLNSEMMSMDDELGAERRKWGAVLTDRQKVMDQWFNTVWLPFWRDWNQFYEKHGNTWGALNWWHNFWGGAWSQTQDYRTRLGEMRKSAEKAGYFFVAPAPTAPKEHPLVAPLSGLWDDVKTVVWVVILVAGVILAIKFLPGVVR